MVIKEAIEMKDKLDRDILDLIRTFEAITFLFVRSVNVESATMLDGHNETILVRTKVEL